MKSIFQNADHAAATAQLAELQAAHNAAALDESQLLVQLGQQAQSKPSALDRAKAMLKGGVPAPRQDHEGLMQRLADSRAKLSLLALAIAEQRGIMAGLVQAQGAIVNAGAKQAHVQAATAIRTALAGLRVAMDTESALRAEIAEAGYQCSLEPLASPELCFAESESTISKFAGEVEGYLNFDAMVNTKSVTVRLLLAKGGGQPGDVVTLPGAEAASLVRHGWGEVTTATPSRAKRQHSDGGLGQALGRAFS